MKVGKNILEIRKSNGMSQEQFGDLFHVTRQTVSNWENEKSYPDLQTLIGISDTFHISLDKLLKEDEQMVKAFDKERKSARISKGIAVILAGCMLTAGIAAKVFVSSFEPAPNAARNTSDTAVTMYLNLPDRAPHMRLSERMTNRYMTVLTERKWRKSGMQLMGGSKEIFRRCICTGTGLSALCSRRIKARI